MFSTCFEKMILKMGKIVQEISKKPLYVCTEAGGWVKSKVYLCVQRELVDQ